MERENKIKGEVEWKSCGEITLGKGAADSAFPVGLFSEPDPRSIGSGASLKWVHVFSLVFLPFLCRKKELRVNRPVLLYVAYAAAVSLLHRREFGVNSLLLNYIFGLYLIVLCANFGADLSKDDWLDIVSGAASILMIVILIKNLIYYQGFLDYLRTERMAHPWGVKMIIGGGSNIESSWLGLLAFFFYRSRWKWLYAGANLMLSFLYGSRAGMLIAAAAILWLLLPQFKRLKERKVRIAVLVLCAALVAALWGSGLLESLVLRSLNRFLHGMEDAGNAGRIRMWTYALETSKAYPFGCGVGNCMKALSGVAASPMGKIISTMFICRTSSTAAGWAGQRIWRWSSGSSGWKRKSCCTIRLWRRCLPTAGPLCFSSAAAIRWLSCCWACIWRTGMQTTKKKIGS